MGGPRSRPQKGPNARACLPQVKSWRSVHIWQCTGVKRKSSWERQGTSMLALYRNVENAHVGATRPGHASITSRSRHPAMKNTCREAPMRWSRPEWQRWQKAQAFLHQNWNFYKMIKNWYESITSAINRLEDSGPARAQYPTRPAGMSTRHSLRVHPTIRVLYE